MSNGETWGGSNICWLGLSGARGMAGWRLIRTILDGMIAAVLSEAEYQA